MIDLILVGGGLANGLIAWRLAMLRPEIRVLVLEATNAVGGNHTWCFHDDDLTPAQRRWTGDLVAHRWHRYRVAFPGFSRSIEGGYNAITSERFRERIGAALGNWICCDAVVSEIAPKGVRLASGEIDCRGRGHRRSRREAESAHGARLFRNSWGRSSSSSRPHGLDRPLIMDADVAAGRRVSLHLRASARTRPPARRGHLLRRWARAR